MLLRPQVGIDKFCFVLGCGTTNLVFILRQLQEKYLTKKEFVLFICIFGESFDQVPRVVFWWALRKLCIEEWLVKIIHQSVYRNALSCVRVNGLHQG